MQAKQKIAVAGATGRVGHHLVDVLRERGHDAVEISRAKGVDVITGAGLDEALVGVDAIVDAATGPSPDQAEATEFFTTSVGNLHTAGQKAGVQRLITVSIVGIDPYTHGYSVAKLEQERAALAGPIPARIARAVQFFEFVDQLVDWGRQGDVAYVAKFRIQPAAARSVAEVLADLALDPESTKPGLPTVDIAGPQEENLVDLAVALMAKRGDPVQIQGASDPSDPDTHLNESGALLPGADAVVVGPTFKQWLDAGERVR
jgi:uncharacterized protein YbjT (DUF2867 family)